MSDETREQLEAMKRLYGDDPMAEHREWLDEYDRVTAEEEARRAG